MAGHYILHSIRDIRDRTGHLRTLSRQAPLNATLAASKGRCGAVGNAAGNIDRNIPDPDFAAPLLSGHRDAVAQHGPAQILSLYLNCGTVFFWLCETI
jgi:hypothetical protein